MPDLRTNRIILATIPHDGPGTAPDLHFKYWPVQFEKDCTKRTGFVRGWLQKI